MSEVTIIGLGEMGSALAGAMVRAGRDVTVWNRTGAKAEGLVQDGARLAASVAAAVGASPVIVICVSDYAATRRVLEGSQVVAALAGRTVVQLSTGTPQEARDTEAWIRGQGADYVDGAILAWPSQIGGAATTILASGDEAVFRRHEALLTTLAGNFTYLGAPVGLAAALFSAVLSYLAGRWIGICHGALICEAEGISVASFGGMLGDLSGILGEDARNMGRIIETGRYGNPESTLKTAGEDIGRLVQQAGEAGINAELPRFAAGLFRRAIDAGHGAEEHAALIKVLRSAA
ncbi:NAD(P)-dependent oxidoreductase [Phreatobacter stygius]|uniref:NAD(P)-dependent oxidoreductase n=2 Tax=Phreatobacter stygius TaxID=1940610 RepID=A0A4D7BA13_9HYPH|nr:NAD(P)-binding domain-containing protein [Phreatobacter stygius]QCI67440.1 NAD(P)-dependent oxidoreductase [Phreatobacter stygius]